MKWRVAVHGVVAIVVLSCSSTSENVSASSQPVATVPPLEGLAKIVVANEHKGGYRRSLFSENKDLDKDGCNTRAEVLERDSFLPVRKSGARCTVVSGKWLSAYDGRTWSLSRDVQIDHLVSLKEVWDSGGWAWSAAQRSDYANDLGNRITLNVATKSENAKKSDNDPSNYLPPLVSYRCTYLANWVAVKVQWSLSMDQSEHGRIKKLLQGCGATSSTSTTVATSTSTSTTTVGVLPLVEGSTAALLASIVVENEYTSGYVRELFPHWKDLDGDSCDTREEVLIRDSLTKVQVDPFGCEVVAGDWLSPYDGARWSDKSNIDIDHVVALKEAWDSGAWAWTTAQRTLYANDLSDARTLLAVTDSVNQSKSDKDPSNWLPPLASYHCTYISDWVSVKARWKLSMDQSEYGRVKKLVEGCGGSSVVTSVLSTVPNVPNVPNVPSVASTAPSGVKYVSPGAYCAPIGAQGIAESKVSYLCATTSATGAAYADGRARWRKG